MNDKSLVPQSSGGAIAPIVNDRFSITSRMTAGMLEIARKRSVSLAEPRFRIGDYELREPDYRQIMLWAEELGLEAEEVLYRLEQGVIAKGFAVENGAVISLVIDFDSLPLLDFQWVDRLLIREIGFKGKFPGNSNDFFIKLPQLEVLRCNLIRLTGLDLSAVPTLTTLRCGGNQLTELDLSAVPALTELFCRGNQLTELDLSAVPALIELNCRGNQLTELDLSTVPALTKLSCGGNQLTELDLSTVPALTILYCGSNQLTELNLSAVPALTTLNCWNNQLTELDLSAVPALTTLNCGENQLTELDLSAVRALTMLECGGNQLTELDIRPLKGRAYLKVDPTVKILRA